MCTSSSCSNVFTPPALIASCFLQEHQWMFEPFLIVVFESLDCPQYEKMDLKIIQSLLERVQMSKRCWQTEESAGRGGFFWRTELSLTVQNKPETHEQPSQIKKTVVDHPGNHTWKGVISIISAFFLSCGLHVNIFYVKYLIQDRTK